jgi:hypothetical protein
VHVCVPTHAVPHEPQFIVSLVRSTQRRLQIVHVAPAEQVSPGGEHVAVQD